jgi:N-acetylmuramoyl-L-alanine amidase
LKRLKTQPHALLKSLSIFFLPLFTLTLFSAVEVSAAEKSNFQKGLNCKNRLMKSESKKRFRHSWEQCIRYFVKAAKTERNPKKIEESLFRTAKLYEGLNRYSGKSHDKRKAIDQYRQLVKHYPKGRFFKTSRRSLASLDGSSLPSTSPSTTPTPPPAKPIMVNLVNYWSFPSYTRVVVELSEEAEFRSERLEKPERLFIDFKNAYLPRKMHNKPILIKDGVLKKVNVAQFDPQTVRLVLNLDQINNFRIVPFENPNRIIIDVYGKNSQVRDAAFNPPQQYQTAEVPKRTNGEITLAQQLGLGINTIVVDPGHGGKDPGAIGRSGVMEKDVVLDISKRLKTLLEKNLGKKVILTRETDIFIPLEERTQMANAQKADLFISIHTNSSPKRTTRGTEIYLVGQSTDRPAMETAARENSASERAMSDLELILNDLLENTKIDESLELAHLTSQSFHKTVGSKYKNVVNLGVKRAPFYVLINASMPSILTEISFISNPQEEKRLKNETYRQKAAEALYQGINQYIASIKVASIR